MTSPVLWVRALFSARMVAVLMVLAVAGSLLYRAVNQEWVLYRQAETAFASGRNADALRLVRTLRDKAPGQKKFHVRVAELALRAGDAELAEQWMNPVLSKGEKLTLSEVRLAAGIADAQRKSGAALGYYEGFVRGGANWTFLPAFIWRTFIGK